jgi:hypothetical protein
VAAILSKQRAETLSSVLYPDDRTYEGKELRLKQQHFFVSATIQVGLRHVSYGCGWSLMWTVLVHLHGIHVYGAVLKHSTGCLGNVQAWTNS